MKIGSGSLEIWQTQISLSPYDWLVALYDSASSDVLQCDCIFTCAASVELLVGFTAGSQRPVAVGDIAIHNVVVLLRVITMISERILHFTRGATQLCSVRWRTRMRVPCEWTLRVVVASDWHTMVNIQLPLIRVYEPLIPSSVCIWLPRRRRIGLPVPVVAVSLFAQNAHRLRIVHIATYRPGLQQRSNHSYHLDHLIWLHLNRLPFNLNRVRCEETGFVEWLRRNHHHHHHHRHF